jgi:hypothetical protein
MLEAARDGDNYMKLVSHSSHDVNRVLGGRLRLILDQRQIAGGSLMISRPFPQDSK